MKNLTFLALASLTLGACGGDDGGGGGGNADAAPDVSSMLTISGIASEITASGRTPQAGVMVTVYKTSDDSLMGMATTDSAGAYSITVQTNGAPVDGYLKATFAGLKDTYLYPPGPLSTDFSGVTTLMLEAEHAEPGEPARRRWRARPREGLGRAARARRSNDGRGRSDGRDDLDHAERRGSLQRQRGRARRRRRRAPRPMASRYAMNVPAGQVMVSASKSGINFKSHSINARADKVTLTLVTP